MADDLQTAPLPMTLISLISDMLKIMAYIS